MRLALLVALAGLAACLAPAAEVTVVPRPIEAVLPNPGMGWQTFHQTARYDRSLPDWIPSTVAYARWGWGELEPRAGQIDYAFLDRELAAARASGQSLAFRVMCCSTSPGKPYHPDWLRQLGGRELLCHYSRGPGLRVPDLDDAVVLERHLDFIRRLGERYDGHADLDHVDIGSVGWWGEWHMSGSDCRMPRLENRRKIIDAYLSAFTKTPLVMLVGDDECLPYAIERGAGWRADCLGDMGGFSSGWNHMRDSYPLSLTQAGAHQAWQKAPVAWETCWEMKKWVAEGWPLRTIFNYALAMHGSYINNKSATLPAGENVRAEVERFLRRLGYRLVLKKLTHPRTASPGATLVVRSTWQNTGSAPCYRPYRLAYRLTDAAGRHTVISGQTTVDRFMPGTLGPVAAEFLKDPRDLPDGPAVEVTDRVELPPGLAAGDYRLSVGVVAETSATPIVRLAIDGRNPDGWYPLSSLALVTGESRSAISTNTAAGNARAK